MKSLKRLFAPKEVKAALGVLDEAGCIFDANHGYLSGAFGKYGVSPYEISF